MTSNILIFLLIFSNGLIVVYFLYQLCVKLRKKLWGENDNDPFADSDIYYKKLINAEQEYQIDMKQSENKSNSLLNP